MKNKFLSTLAMGFVSLGMLVSGITKANLKDVRETRAEDTYASVTSIAWNNVNYEGAGSAQGLTGRVDVNNVPQEGYCVLLILDMNIGATPAPYFTKNLISETEKCNAGTYILVNGQPINTVEGAGVYVYPDNGLFIYAPEDSADWTTYTSMTFELVEGLQVGSDIKIHNRRMGYLGALGSYGSWKLDPTDAEVITERPVAHYNCISWNNVNYFANDWFPISDAGAPTEGYLLLILFGTGSIDPTTTLPQNPENIGTYDTTTNQVNNASCSAREKILANGKPLKDLAGSQMYIYPNCGLIIYFTDASLDKVNYAKPTLEITQGASMTRSGAVLEPKTFEFNGTLGKILGWDIQKPRPTEKLSLNGIAPGWNNLASGTNVQVIMSYGEHGTDYFADNQTAEGTNRAVPGYEIGTFLTLNGQPFSSLSGVTISYIHGYGYMYICMPTTLLTPSNGYKVVTLSLRDDTVFVDKLAEGFTLYLHKGLWQTECPATPDDNDYTSASTFTDVFGKSTATIDDTNNTSVEGNATGTSFLFTCDYKFKNTDDSFAMYFLSKNNFSGIKLFINGNKVALNDATTGNEVLGQDEYSDFAADEWFNLLIKATVNETTGAYNFYVSIDGITYVAAENITLKDATNIGTNVSIYAGEGESTFRDALLNTDIKKPILYYQGKDTYRQYVGDEVKDFTTVCSAEDVHDGKLTSEIQITLPLEASTNNKWNRGLWVVEISVSDAAGNKASKEVTVIVTAETEYAVTFNGENVEFYTMGSKINKPADPTVEATEQEEYQFIGWYYNNMPWDFERDYVMSDMNLEAKFVTTARKYVLTVKVEGLGKGQTMSFYFNYGTKVSFDELFAKKGYTYKVFSGSEEITELELTANTEIKVVYTKENSGGGGESRGGCGGSIIAASTLVALLSLAGIGITLRKRNSKKED